MNYSLIAQEAMHNVLIAAGLTHNSRTKETTEQCFESLFLQGFWKKLVYMIDVESSQQLCYALGQVKNYKLNYMVDVLGVKEKQRVIKAYFDHGSFKSLVLEESKEFRDFEEDKFVDRKPDVDSHFLWDLLVQEEAEEMFTEAFVKHMS